VSELESNVKSIESNVKSIYETARELAGDLGKLSKSWIRYGLTVGESSMQASAHTLDEVAEALRKVAEKLRTEG
jgi:uncharacterized protein YukE